jgi:hypothetical protein
MASGETERRDLSTGHAVELPLSCRAGVGGAVFAADWAPLRAALPRDLTPLRLGTRRGAVVLAGVDYRSVGSLTPYSEFAVVVPVAAAGVAGFPTDLSAVGGYVVDLPVSTDPARALGAEVWGFPKSVTGVAVDATPTALTVRVDAAADGGEATGAATGGETGPAGTTDGEGTGAATDDVEAEPAGTTDGGAATAAASRAGARRDVELAVDVDGAPARRVERRLVAYAYRDDRLVRVPVDLDATVRVARGGDGVRLGRGSGRYAAVLSDLGLRPRVFARFVASHATATVHPPVPAD